MKVCLCIYNLSFKNFFLNFFHFSFKIFIYFFFFFFFFVSNFIWMWKIQDVIVYGTVFVYEMSVHVSMCACVTVCLCAFPTLWFLSMMMIFYLVCRFVFPFFLSYLNCGCCVHVFNISFSHHTWMIHFKCFWFFFFNPMLLWNIKCVFISRLFSILVVWITSTCKKF